MKAILEFDLSDHDGKMEHMRCVKALSMAIALWDMEQYLRASIKHAPDSMSSEAYGMLNEVRDKFYEIMNDNNIDLDELLN